MRSFKTFVTIAGSDPTGGAGLQADLKTAQTYGVYATSVVTCVTAQNSHGLSALTSLTPEMLSSQLNAISDEIGIDAIKTGLFSSADQIAVVADWIKIQRSGKVIPVTVVDPVLSFTAGGFTSESSTLILDAYVEKLLPVCDIITPNRDELRVLAARCGESSKNPIDQARRLIEKGCRYVVITGSDTGTDLLVTATDTFDFKGVAIETPNLHGTGCLFSSAIACSMALKRAETGGHIEDHEEMHELRMLRDCIEKARGFIRESLLRYKDVKFGRGYGPANMFLK